ncbi:MAG: tetratricopeptide repeat protein, partial [Anaerolineae bacterium]|nr:tetratricopeptide repeat protein [Anaerolineae bacterium]
MRNIHWWWFAIAILLFVIVMGLSILVAPTVLTSLANLLLLAGVVAVGVVTVVAGMRAIVERKQGADVPAPNAGAQNTSTIGDGANVDQAIVGDYNTQKKIQADTYIETQIVNTAARQEIDARFSLPAKPEPFEGREDEVREVVRRLREGRGSLVSGLAGFGGVGKTAIAIVAAHEVAGEFLDGQIWVELRGTGDSPMTVSEAMMFVIRALKPDADLTKVESIQLEGEYRTLLHGKKVLLGLDNARDASQVQQLLVSPPAAMLVTARTGFMLAGLVPLRLDTLKKEDAEKLLVELCPRIDPSPPDPLPGGEGGKDGEGGNAAAELAELCGYLPLALRIAGRYLAEHEAIPVARYVKQVRERRLHSLKTMGERDLAAVFAETYDLLPGEMQTRWRALGVIPASFTAVVAGYLWELKEPEDAHEILGELVRMSIVEYDVEGERFDLHDLLREFALGRLTEEERRAAEKRYAELSKFTGRTAEIETLTKQLTDGRNARIAGVSGLGGIGKSALARAVADLVAPQFPDGQLWIDLRGTSVNPTRPADAMRQVILALEPTAVLHQVDDDALAQQYMDVLRGKRVLIVLDNAADNAQLRSLLQAHAAFLVTSRTPISEAGLRTLRLDVLPEAAARAYLLAQGARLTAEEADALATICGYLPLALKIAGSYLVAHPDINRQTYLAQLRERELELLRERNDTDLNVEAMFNISYNQLTPNLQTLWRLLGVFPAPFWDHAAQYVWGVEDEAQAEAALGELYRGSLVEYDAESDRFDLHDLLREFAQRRITQDERRKVEVRYAEFFKEVAGEADDLYLKGGENVVAGLRLFERELTHINAGQKWAAENWETDRDAARLCIEYPLDAAHTVNLRLSSREQLRWLNDAVKAARKLGDKRSGENALGSLGNAYADLGEVRQAIGYYEQALVIDRELGDRRGEGTALGNLGSAYADLGEVRQAIGYYEHALVIAREIGDRRGEGTALGNLG